jgi:phospholipid/cholesterol/gamma-HCH transport system substrate-binding protein
METKASYLIVGGFVLSLVVGLFLFVIWLTGSATTLLYTEYRTYFTGSVTGLQVGGVVRYRGIPVGTVTHMNIDPDNSEQIEVGMEVQSDTPVKLDTEASLETTGLTGVAYILLSGGGQASPLLKPKPGKRVAIIMSRPSQLEKVFSAAPKLLDRASEALNDRNLKAFSDTLENIKSVTGAVAAKDEQIQAAIDDAAATVHQLRSASASIDTLIKNLNTDATNADATLASVKRLADNANEQTTQVAGDLRHATQSINRLSDELNALVAEDRRPIKDFSSQGLYELTQFITDARTMVESITRLANKIEADPARFFFGNQQQGVPAR